MKKKPSKKEEIEKLGARLTMLSSLISTAKAIEWPGEFLRKEKEKNQKAFDVALARLKTLKGPWRHYAH